MNTYEIVVETGPCGWDYYTVEQKAKDLESAIRLVEKKAKKERPWEHIYISPDTCKEIVQQGDSTEMSIMPEEWIARGYRRHEVSESRREMNKLADFILQKRVDDEKGKKYYITVYSYDRRRYPYPHNEMGDPFGYMVSVQFDLRDGKPFFNIEMNAVKGIDDVEAAYEGFWNHLGRPYYETWEEA